MKIQNVHLIGMAVGSVWLKSPRLRVARAKMFRRPKQTVAKKSSAESKVFRKMYQKLQKRRKKRGRRKPKEEFIWRKQRRIGLQKHRARAKSQKSLDIFVNGVKSSITEEHLRNHFACFGEVVDVHMVMNYSNEKPGGSAYIAILPQADRSQILKKTHVVQGITMHIKKWRSYCNVTKELRRTKKEIGPEHQIPLPKQTLSSTTYTIEQQAQEQSKQQHEQDQQQQQQKEEAKQDQLEQQDKTQERKGRKRLQKEEWKLRLQKHMIIVRSQRALDVFVNGVRSTITTENLSDHFEAFGRVLDVCMHGGSAYIAIQPTEDASQIQNTEHIVNEVPIYVKYCSLGSDLENKPARTKQTTVLKIKRSTRGGKSLSKKKAIQQERARKKRNAEYSKHKNEEDGKKMTWLLYDIFSCKI